MNVGLALAFLFFAGALLGWGIEFLYRNLISHRGPRGRFFINPGFCKGPYLPIYGVGITVMFVISYFFCERFKGASAILIILGIAVMMTLIELVGGIFLLKVMNLRLWDYRDCPGNFMGIICPKFSLIWGAIGAAYYLFVHEIAIGWLEWLSQNLAFSFFIGLFYGVFVLDLLSSYHEASIIKQFGDEHDIIVKYEELKALVQKKRLENEEKAKFFRQTVVSEGTTLRDNLQEHTEAHENKGEAFYSHRGRNWKKLMEEKEFRAKAAGTDGTSDNASANAAQEKE